MEQPAQLEVLGEHPDAMRVGRFRNLIVVAWSGHPSGAAVHTLLEIMKHLHRDSSEVRSYIHMLPDQVPVPDAIAREGFSYLMSHYEPYIACVAVVIEGSGFWACAMRSVVLGLRLLVRTPFDFRMEPTPEAVLAWLPDSHARRTGVRLTAHELLELFTEARRWQHPKRKATARMSVFRAR